jgi:hypothetical protein
MKNPARLRRAGQVEIGHQADNQNITRRPLHHPRRRLQYTSHRRHPLYAPRPVPVVDPMVDSLAMAVQP